MKEIKEKLPVRMTALLSFVILAMGGKEVACLKQGEDTSRAHMNHQVNKTILVCTCIHLILYVYISSLL
jgi:hypothetical protein